MSDLVKRLSFSVIQTPAFSDTISNSPTGKKPSAYSWYVFAFNNKAQRPFP